MKIRRLKEKQRSFYKSIVSVSCPILDDTVYFTSEGFNHLIYESNRKPRKISEQYMKLSCLNYVVEVISKCSVVSSTRKLKRKIKGREKEVIHYELAHEVSKSVQIRVIVERVGTGKAKFMSIMPHNKKSKPKTKKRF